MTTTTTTTSVSTTTTKESSKVAILAIVQWDSDEPVYLKDLKSLSAAAEAETSIKKDEFLHLYQFVLHASLDMVEEKLWQNPGVNLGVVENFRDNSVSAWIGAGGAKILLLQRGYSEQQVKGFLKQVSSIWFKTAVNPLRDRHEPIEPNSAFESKLAAAVVKWL